MSKNKRHTKYTQGKEWWGKRPLSGYRITRRKSGTNKWFKRRLHKIERQLGKREYDE